MSDPWRLVIDLAIVLLLIVGIGQFRTPRRARGGNLTAAFALACALGIVLYRSPVLSPAMVLIAFMAGSLVGWAVAMRADMIQIPAMVAFQHGAGGTGRRPGVVRRVDPRCDVFDSPVAVGSGILALAVGAATFSASMIASGKLARVLRQSTTVLPNHDRILIAMIVAVVALALAAGTLTGTAAAIAILGTLVASILIGVVFSIRVGGADMPVLISFLNATSGLAAALCGIVIQNRLLIACGATVAASGYILTHAMCKAMNRRLGNVFVGIAAAPVAAAPVAAALARWKRTRPAPRRDRFRCRASVARSLGGGRLRPGGSGGSRRGDGHHRPGLRDGDWRTPNSRRCNWPTGCWNWARPCDSSSIRSPAGCPATCTFCWPKPKSTRMLCSRWTRSTPNSAGPIWPSSSARATW